MMKHVSLNKFRGQAGDTIVEVMIVLAVLALAFTVSYATATHGLAQSRNAEEHSEALGVLNTQVELMRTALARHVPIPNDPPSGFSSANFCMSDASNPPTVNNFNNYIVPPEAANDNAIGSVTPPNAYPAPCVHGFYHTSIVYDHTTNAYDLRVRWDGIGNLGRQQEEFNYKVSPLAASFSPYAGSPALNSPSVRVSVQKINAVGNAPPACNSTNPKSPLPGVQVTLNTGQSGTNVITDLLDGQSYTGSITDARYQNCPTQSTPATASTIPPYNQVDVVVASTCSTVTPPYDPTPKQHNPPLTLYWDNYVWAGTGRLDFSPGTPPVDFYYGPYYWHLYQLSNGVYLTVGGIGIYNYYLNQPIPYQVDDPAGWYADPPPLPVTTCT